MATFNEIFQQYLQQGFTKPQGIETISPVQTAVKPILPKPETGDSGGITTTIDYDPNVGKNFYDYEADAYGVGPTLRGGIAQLWEAYKNLPTPLNLAIRAGGFLIDKYGQPTITETPVVTSPTISGGDTGGGTISFSDESGYGGTGTSSPSAVGSTGMLGGGV